MFPVATDGSRTGLGMVGSRTAARFTGECEGWLLQVALVRRVRSRRFKTGAEEAENP
jgi:hypothetical protein